jgi:hypothetical protein
MEDHVVFAAKEENFASRRGQLAAKGLSELNGGKSSADDDYFDWFHVVAPMGVAG